MPSYCSNSLIQFYRTTKQVENALKSRHSGKSFFISIKREGLLLCVCISGTGGMKPCSMVHSPNTQNGTAGILRVCEKKLCIIVPDHDGGRPMEVNACILITHMVYL